MKNIERSLWILLLMCSTAYAGRILTPPPLPTLPKDLSFYLKSIQEKINVMEVVDTAPNGTRQGDNGEFILYNNSGTYELWVNSSSGGGTSWQRIS